MSHPYFQFFISFIHDAYFIARGHYTRLNRMTVFAVDPFPLVKDSHN